MGLPPALLHAIQKCYENALAQVSINRHLSDPIKLMRGITRTLFLIQIN
jgi:hypothetical protein